jgi:hypothetical protein
MMRAHQPGSQPIDVPEAIPNPAVPRTVPSPEPRPSEPIKVPAPGAFCSAFSTRTMFRSYRRTPS